MRKICIIYDSVSGSTAEIADMIKKELLQRDFVVSSYRVDDVEDLNQFETVIIGSPMRFGGFTSKIKKFLNKHKDELEQLNIICFFSILYVVKIAEEPAIEIPCYVDPSLDMQTISRKSGSGMDKAHSLGHYLRTLQKKTHGLKFVSIAFFNGRLDLNRLGLFERIFMIIVISLTTKQRVGEFLNPKAVTSWTKSLQI